MRAIANCITCLLLFLLAAAQACASGNGRWQCDGKFGLCRYVEDGSGREIIPARFERGMPFSQGLAAVRLNGLYGYIDESGKFVIEPRFDLAGPFVKGMAEILAGHKAGIIDRSGRIVVEPRFRRALVVNEKMILASEGDWTSWRVFGAEGLESLFGNLFRIEKAGLYSIDGHWIRKPDLLDVSAFDKEVSALWAKAPDSKLYGLLAPDGTWIVEPQYDHVQPGSDGLAIVGKTIDRKQLYGAIDRTGRVVVSLEARGLEYWNNGWGIASDHSQGRQRMALLDRNGRIVGNRYFDDVRRAERGDIALVLIDGRWQGLDRAGNIVPNPENGQVIASCPGGLRMVRLDGLAQITDSAGQPTSMHLFADSFRWNGGKPPM